MTKNNWMFWRSQLCMYHRAAQKEFIYVLFFSLSPIMAAFLCVLWVKSVSEFEAMYRVIGHGELIVYSATLVTPIMYSTQKDPPVKGKHAFFFVCLSILGIGAFYYGLATAGLISKPLFGFSLAVAFVSILLLYMYLFYEHRAVMANSSPVVHSKEDEKFRKNFRDYMKEGE